MDVNILLGQGSANTVQAVDTGKAEIGISDAPVPIKGRAQGANVKIIGIIFDKHPNCMYFWKESGIRKPQDIVGKTVAVPAADGHYVMWPAFAKQIGVDPGSVKFVNIEPTAKVAALATKKADVVFELYTGKPFMEKGIPPDQLGTILWSDHGFNAYAHSYITRDDVIQKNPDLLKKFLKASYRAWDFTLKNPEEAIFPEASSASLAKGDRQRPFAHRDPGDESRIHDKEGGGASGSRRSEGLREKLPQRALRWNVAARLHRPGPGFTIRSSS